MENILAGWVGAAPVSAGGIFPLKIVGLYQSGIADVDNVRSFAKLQTVQRILGQPQNYITDINIKLHDINQAVPMATELQSQLGIRARDIIEANAQFETGTSIRNLITYAVSITLLIVAGFGIYNILNMIIYEKNILHPTDNELVSIHKLYRCDFY